MNKELKKYSDPVWDFKSANTKKHTHCFHSYPAMMIPQIAHRLIDIYGQNSKTLFDPYCGSGTSLVEANLNGINAIGTDLNPMARLISKAKTTPIEISLLDTYLESFYNFALTPLQEKPIVSVPYFKNIDFWFSEQTKISLSQIKNFINSITEPHIKDFFKVAFSETIRESSFTRNNEFKLYKMSEKQREKFNPNAFVMMNEKLIRNRNGLESFMNSRIEPNVETTVLNFDSSIQMDLDDNSVEIVVTSPPYGDSKTTVAYGQFSRLSNQWLDIENANKVDSLLMGGKPQPIKTMDIPIIDNIISEIAEKDEKRARDVYSFYYDYSNSIANVSNIIKHNGYACYVVGNRRVKGITLPTDEITKVLFEKHGFIYKNTFIRNIPNKRMPKANSPTNEVGKKETTMNNEYIVVMQKR